VRLPDSKDLHAFCKADGWSLERETGHAVYSKTLITGFVLTTIVSHGNKQIHDPDLFARICREELECTPAQFWDAVDNGTNVPRPQPEQPEPEDPIPLGLIKALSAQGHPMDRISQIRTKTEALELLHQGPLFP
jgi:hypothetical protein